FEGENGALLRAEGNVLLNFFGFAIIDGFFIFEKSTSTVTLANGETLAVDQMLIGAIGVDAFIGINGPASNDGALGFSITNADIALALMSAQQPAAPAPPSTDLRSFIALKVDVKQAGFVGVDGLTVAITDLKLAINQAGGILNGNPVDTNNVVDFNAGGSQPGTQVTIGALTLDFDGDDGALLRAEGNVELNFFGFAIIDGFFIFEKSSANVTLSDGTTLDVDRMLIGAVGVDAFIGINGPATNAGALGFDITDADIALALMSAKQPAAPAPPSTDLRSFTALEVEVASASFIGVDGLTIAVNSMSFSLNQAGGTLNGNPVDGSVVVDFNAGGSVTGTPLTIGALTLDFEGENGPLLEASGELELNVFDVVFVTAGFELRKQTVDVDVNGNGVLSTTERDLDNAGLLTLSLTISDFFAGIPGGIGFQVNSGQIAIAIIKPDPVLNPADDRSFLAFSSNISGASLAGLPPELVIEATRLEVEINSASGTPVAPATVITPLNWNVAVDLQPGDATFDADPVVVGGQTFDFTGAFTRIGGALTLDAFG
ncbi:MAG TPA: hypothetical protein VF987_11880, partial [Rhodospirillales bacterium]